MIKIFPTMLGSVLSWVRGWTMTNWPRRWPPTWTRIRIFFSSSKVWVTAETGLVILYGESSRCFLLHDNLLCFRCNFEGTLKDLLVYFRPKQVKRIYYQRLSIPINELEYKRQFKCTWLLDPPNGEERDLVLYPNR